MTKDQRLEKFLDELDSRVASVLAAIAGQESIDYHLSLEERESLKVAFSDWIEEVGNKVASRDETIVNLNELIRMQKEEICKLKIKNN